MSQTNIFAEETRYSELTKLGDPLEKLNKVINWAMFLPIINRVFAKEQKGAGGETDIEAARPKGGRPAYDQIMMFKIMVLQRLFNLSDDQTEFQIKDRMSFMRFLGLRVEDRVPDAKTIWLFRETLVKADAAMELFRVFDRQLAELGIITRRGSIVDASFIDAPRQRNTREENATIKSNGIPEEWKKAENVNKMRQKDVDARWAKKGKEVHFEFKNHSKVDVESKLITDYAATDASVHDSQEMETLIDVEKDEVVWIDSAYVGEERVQQIRNEARKEGRIILLRIIEKGYKNAPLTEAQKAENKRKSSIRCRIEHVFGFMTNSMRGMNLRCIGRRRAAFNIGITNLVYNLCRYEFLCRPPKTKA